MKNIIILLSAVALCVSVATAQPVRGIPLDAKQKEAQTQQDNTNYYYAVEWAKKVREDLPKDQPSLQMIAMSEMMMRDYPASAIAYQELLKNDSTAQQYQEDRFNFARVLKMDGKYKEAKYQFEQFLKSSQDAAKRASAEMEIKGIDMAQKATKTEGVMVKNAGTAVNSAYSEVSPFLFGEDIYFSSIRSDVLIELNPEGKPTSNKVKDQYSKVYKSAKSADNWASAKALDAAINKLGIHNANVSLSEDGNMLFFSRCVLNGMKENCDVYVSMKVNGAWADAQKVTGGVNGDDFSSKHATVGKINNKTAIFFAANMAGGKGGYDIYYAVHESGAAFSTPVNVDAPVNTAQNEETPFYKNDVLYFSSEGHPSFGGYDVFKASQSGVKWSGVENMGADVNSSADDLHYTLDASGFNGAFSSNRATDKEGIAGKSSTCCFDVYTITYPIPVIVDLEVLAFDTKGEELSGVTLALVEGDTKDEQTNDRSNFFKWEDINKETTYKVVATKAGYKPAEIEISTKDIAASKTLKEKVSLEEIPVVIIDLEVEVLTDNGEKLTGVTVTLEEVGGSKDEKSSETENTFKWGDLKKGTTYRVTASKPEWGSASQEFTTENVSKSITLNEKLSLKEPFTVSESRPIQLRNINFDLAKWDIRPDARPQLDKLAELLRDIPAIQKVEMSAHTDSRGSDTYNLNLSQKRAQSAVDYLVSKGIDRNRLVAVGKGEKELVNQCKNGVKCSDDEHERNRRVEFRILEGPKTVPADYFLDGVTGEKQKDN